jgi:hypothetical protein
MDNSYLKLTAFKCAVVCMLVCFIIFLYLQQDALWGYGVLTIVLGQIGKSLQVTLESLNKNNDK